MKASIQIFCLDGWREAATVEFLEPAKGVAGATLFSYDLDYAFDVASAEIADGLAVRDERAVSVAYPIGLEDRWSPRWPSFLLDYLPQGRNRELVAHSLGIPSAASTSDLPILLRAAGSPVGNLRVVDPTVSFAPRPPGGAPFVPDRIPDFERRLRALHEACADLVPVALGLSGEWPKMAVTADLDGCFRADGALDDRSAAFHSIAKFPRTASEIDLDILKGEAGYSSIAADLGLYVHAPVRLMDGMTLHPRFDRHVGAAGVTRVGQESLASAIGAAEFGYLGTHEGYVRAISDVSSDPRTDVVEYVLRDVANVALGNPDNHGRNSALLKLPGGRVRLAPLFDFAPMRISGRGIMRSSSWACMKAIGADHTPDWRKVCEAAAPDVVDPDDLHAEIVALAGRLGDVLAEIDAYDLPDRVRSMALAQGRPVVDRILDARWTEAPRP